MRFNNRPMAAVKDVLFDIGTDAAEMVRETAEDMVAVSRAMPYFVLSGVFGALTAKAVVLDAVSLILAIDGSNSVPVRITSGVMAAAFTAATFYAGKATKKCWAACDREMSCGVDVSFKPPFITLDR